MKFKHFIAVLLLGAATFAGSDWLYARLNHHEFFGERTATAAPLFKAAKYTDNTSSVPMTDFESAAAKATPAVVHIKLLKKGGQPVFDLFGGNGDDDQNNAAVPRQVASGSGVLVSANGYIVTNNHVVDHADEMVVTLNDKNDYKATLVGTDPSSDIAIIKIEGANFPFLNFANSDDVRVGQWILAIGYPLNLETTVTSGIVSAKARTLGLNEQNSRAPIESFIQTDAAVNPGNSGGALVNTNGDLIGINSAIASPTGSFAGYSYAIPSNVVARVASDIIKYGSAKRGYLGVLFGNDRMTNEDRKNNHIPEGNGVYVIDVSSGSAAAEAGIQSGDFIIKLNGITMNTGTELVGKISSLRPGDAVQVTYVHSGKEHTVRAVLKGTSGAYRGEQTPLQQPEQPEPQQEPMQ